MITRIVSGKHEFLLEQDDLIVLRLGAGAVGADEVQAMHEIEKLVWSRPYVYSLVMMDDGTSILPGALSQASQKFHKAPPRSTAVVARKFFLRNAMEFLVRTVRLLGAKLELGFFDDEQAARQWLAECRMRRTASVAREARDS